MSNKTTTITKGGFEVIDFKKLETPIYNHILEPHIYEGYIVDFQYDANTINKEYYCTWDKFGRCYNQSRIDCFIDVENL